MCESENRLIPQSENIKHHTEMLPGVCRTEIYQLADIEYREMFDDLTGDRLSGSITMYGGGSCLWCGCRRNADYEFPNRLGFRA